MQGVDPRKEFTTVLNRRRVVHGSVQPPIDPTIQSPAGPSPTLQAISQARTRPFSRGVIVEYEEVERHEIAAAQIPDDLGRPPFHTIAVEEDANP